MKIDNILLLLFSFLAFLIPLSRKLGSFVIGAILILIIIRVFIHKKSILTQVDWKMLLLQISLFTIYAISLFWTENYSKGWASLTTKLSLIILPVCFAMCPVERKSRVLLSFVAGVFMASIICYSYAFYNYYYSHHVYGNNMYYFFYEFLARGVGLHSAYFSLFVSFSIFILSILCYQYWTQLNKIFKALAIFVILYLIVFNFLLSSRMPLVIFLVIFIGFLVVNLIKYRLVLYSAFVVFAILILSLLLTDNFFKERFLKFDKLEYTIDDPNFKSWNGITTRMAIWTCTWQIIKDNPFGVGIGDAQEALKDKYRKVGFKYALNSDYNEHNQYWQVTLSVGYLGLILLIGSLVIPLYSSLRNHNKLAVVFYLLIIGVFISESYLSRYHGVVFFAFFSALFMFNRKVK